MNNSFTLEGRKILIIGASSGIGKETAIQCAKLGATLTLLSRNSEKLERLIDELDGENHSFYSVDITDVNRINEVIPQIEKQDGIVYNAGTIKTLPAKFIQDNDITEIFKTNFNGLVNINTSILQNKKIVKNSSIVFVSSITGGIVSEPGNSIYSASKGALTAYAKVLALELASRKIRVNIVSPGMIKTSFLEKCSIDTEQFHADEKRYPFGYGEALDVANTIIFLLSEASKWMTGSNIILDGGLTLQ